MKNSKRVVLTTIIILTNFFCTIGYSQTKNTNVVRNEIYKNYSIEYIYVNDISKTYQIKLFVNITDNENKNSYRILLRFVPKNNKPANFDYIMLLQENLNKASSKPLINYKYAEPINLDTLSKDIKTLIDRKFITNSSTIADKKNLKTILLEAKKNIDFLCKRDYKNFANSLYPFTLDGKTYTQRGQELESIFNSDKSYNYLKGLPTIKSDIINNNGELQCFMKWEFDVFYNNENRKRTMNIVALSLDMGKNWYFIEIQKEEIPDYQETGVFFIRPKISAKILALIK